ncbi:hypothetical protein TNCV_751681 [Trichonephila clavipes]|uniref:Uncharacterized protein n=1 Tax=Trichonephila clavipes TaxID=2585209 RepID=A0A8X6WAB7_TRICX|nr:hypothetical protein TNCV_751681 [Trichonephila clavipes]
MFRSGGQSDAKTPSVKFPRKLGTHLSTHCRDERLSQPCPARDLNLRHVRHTPGLALHTTVAGKCPRSPGDEQGQVKKDYPLHLSHTTQMIASKARQGRLTSPGAPALYR